jgi:hypothetical protein
MENSSDENKCNKNKFPDGFTAHYMLSKLIRSQKYTPQVGKTLGVYFCDECHYYHFGHSSINFGQTYRE